RPPVASALADLCLFGCPPVDHLLALDARHVPALLDTFNEARDDGIEYVLMLRSPARRSRDIQFAHVFERRERLLLGVVCTRSDGLLRPSNT
ncbi:hypothetical protein, partial [Mesorhizobium sp. M7A.F.Ca.MR.148.00.0.0]|uniref:hypothetical protein n=1 Tax=Mesorhizobium sp. M7A.F.Ca.MR.148.00.0.0 TaxID=2496775 RepID=UPI0019D08180